MIKMIKENYEYTTYKLEETIGRKIPVGVSKTIYALKWSGVPLAIITLIFWDKL